MRSKKKKGGKKNANLQCNNPDVEEKIDDIRAQYMKFEVRLIGQTLEAEC